MPSHAPGLSFLERRLRVPLATWWLHATLPAPEKAKGLAALNLLTPVNSGAGEKSRTPDLRITNALLYQLSYTGFLWLPPTRAMRFQQNQNSSRWRVYFRSKAGSFFATATFFSVTYTGMPPLYFG